MSHIKAEYVLLARASGARGSAPTTHLISPNYRILKRKNATLLADKV
jgi:hypothetical protein